MSDTNPDPALGAAGSVESGATSTPNDAAAVVPSEAADPAPVVDAVTLTPAPPARARTAPPPASIPPLTWPWVATVVVCLAALAWGIYGYIEHVEYGFIASGMRDPGRSGAAWGLGIMFDVYFIGVAMSGVGVMTLGRLLRVQRLEPISRIATLMSIACLLAAACAVLSDLGRPLDGLMKLPRLANPRSPFFGTFTLVVSAYLFASVTHFFLDSRADAAAQAQRPGLLRFVYRLWASGFRDTPAQRARHHRVGYWLALATLPLIIVTSSTLGFVFGIQPGRPGWYSALQAPAFVAIGAMSGVAFLILLVAGIRRLCHLHDQIPDETIRLLGNLLWVLTATVAYLQLVEVMTAMYAGPSAEREVMSELLRGTFAPVFWSMVGALFLSFWLPFGLYLRGRGSPTLTVIAALAATLVSFLKRYLVVTPSQTHGHLLPIEAKHPYIPTLAEYAIVVGLFGLIVLVYMVVVRVFPIVPIAGRPARDQRKPPHDLLRLGLTALTALAGVALIGAGLADSFRMFSGTEIDPRIPYSPMIFATGVILLFASAAVYELFPDPKQPGDE